MINVCVPVLKRYDLLAELLDSLTGSTVAANAMVYIVDNGRDHERVQKALLSWNGPSIVKTPVEPMGVAEAWNWFIDYVPQERLIVNDDITFAPRSIERMVAESACFVSCTFGFSCFLLRDECVRLVGRFDETISPGYAYFEDRDYLRRMRQVGIQDAVVDCGVTHGLSRTIAAFTPDELMAHHKKFVLAQENFLAKWGSLDEDLVRQRA